MISPLSGGARRRVDHYDCAKFVAGCSIYPSAAYLPYRRSAKIKWSSFPSSCCWFPCTFADGRLHQLPSTEVTVHKPAASGELAPPQMLTARVVTGVVDESVLCVIPNAVAHLGLPFRSDKATPSVLLALPGVIVDVRSLDLDAKGDWDMSDIPQSGVIDIRSSLLGDFPLIQEKCD